MTLSVVTLPEGQLRSPKETLMSVEFFCKLLLGNKELRDSCSEQFSHHFSLVLWAVMYEMQHFSCLLGHVIESQSNFNLQVSLV